jgi:hypothetical protein
VEVNTFDWVRNPLNAKMMAGTLTTTKEGKCIDVSSSALLKIKFPTIFVPEFWISV